jgi:aryl-alcohol dehydrogenase-like predicted oxidoreductase
MSSQYVTLGKTGLVISRLGFGTGTFGKAQQGQISAMYKVDQALANKMVGYLLDSGINYFNTADAYALGESELILGRAIGKHRDEVVLSTKVGCRSGAAIGDAGLSRRHIIHSAENSLKRLGTDWIDVYLLHQLDANTPLEETLEALNDLVRSGKVRYVGFSNWPAWLAAKAIGLQSHHGWARFTAAEMYYSLLGRELEHEIVPFAVDAGVGIVAWSVLAGGFLSGKYTRHDPTGGGGRLADFNILKFDWERGYDLVERLGELGRKHEATPAQVAIAWVLSKPFISNVLLGASSLVQLEELIETVEVELDAAEIASLDELTAVPEPYPYWFNRKETVREVIGLPKLASL